MPALSTLQNAIRTSRGAFFYQYAKLNNAIVTLDKQPAPPPTPLRELQEVRDRARPRTDISDHLPVIFAEALEATPKLIVELGVRGGESTFVFERVARLCDSTLVSVDIDDCSHISSWDKWHFVQEDDVAFAKRFPEWLRNNGIEQQQIDVLFIDTSHLYEHTVQEIASWFPLLSDKARVFFHDTNLKAFYFRRDGTMGMGWNNHRGVIRALEEHLGTKLPEKRDFVDARCGWIIRHYSNCSGLTVLSCTTLT